MMPKVNVYLPDELADRVKAAGIPVSAVCQRALEDALRQVTALQATVELSAASAQLVGDMSRFTNRARTAVRLAWEEAERRKHSYAGTEHLVLGLVGEGGNLALGVLQKMGIDLGAVKAGIDELMGPDGETPVGDRPASSQNLRKAFELALGEALKLGHNYIGCEHLLLGIVQEPEGVGGRVLRALGADITAVRRVTVEALATYTKADPMQEVLRRLEAIEGKLKQ